MQLMHLGHAHQGWDNAVHICTAVGQSLLFVGIPIYGLQSLIQCLELQGRLLLCQLHSMEFQSLVLEVIFMICSNIVRNQQKFS